VIDLDKVRGGAANPIETLAIAGCNPVRVALSGDGATVWLTARGGDEVQAFDTGHLQRGDGVPILAHIRVGRSPVALGVRPDGAQVWVGNSDRFSGGAASSLNLLEGASPAAMKPVATLQSGAFPREMSWLPDGRTLIVTEFGAQTVRLVPTDRIPQRP